MRTAVVGYKFYSVVGSNNNAWQNFFEKTTLPEP
jgi:hypothetical protein